MDPLRVIAARASTLRERLGPGLRPGAARDERTDALLHVWLWAAAEGDAALFHRRLAWDQLDEQRAWRALAQVELARDAPLPDWALAFEEMLRLGGAAHASERCLDAGDPIAFEEVLLPFVTWARLACRREAGDAYGRFADAAHGALERQLLRTLSGHASRAMFVELSLELAAQPLDALVASGPSDAIYRGFVQRMRAEPLAFFLEYAALARVLATATLQWVAATAELLLRFSADARLIGGALGMAHELDVAAVAIGLSDPHNGSRSVAVLTFGCGRRIVYKPRSLALDAGFNRLLDWLSELGAPVSLQGFAVLCRGSYGWAQHVDYAPCKDRDEAREYYLRAGALLCVVHLLHGTDCHGDNLIAAGKYPTLIDVETMLAPKPRDLWLGADATQLARTKLTSSVLNTYLLPAYTHALHDGSVFDGSGLGANPDQDRAATFEGWTHVNTDAMRLAQCTRATPPAPRAAMSDGAVLNVYEHEPELVAGFQATYRFLSAHKAQLLAPDSPFRDLGACEVRYVHRNTTLYSHVLRALQNPRFCRDGAERSLQIEQLALLSLQSAAHDGRPGWTDIWNAERECMERGDVPQFSVLAGGDALALSPGAILPGWFQQSGHARAVERLERFDEDDLAFQVDVIRSSLRSRAPRRTTVPPARSALDLADAPSDDALLQEAVEIGAFLSRAAIHGSDHSAAWLHPVWTREHMLASPQREMDVVGSDLYDGAAGIGLFLAALERRTSAGFGTLAVAAVRPVLIELEQSGERLAQALGIGGLSGLGSIVYGLTQIARLLADARVLAGAEQAAALITDRRIAEDGASDVTLGTAGALLALLSLHELNPSDATLERAIACGEQLRSRLTPAVAAVRSIRSLEGRFLTGFSHGAAGIAYALCRLHAVTGDVELLAAARELVAFERTTFAPDEADWPDLRYPESRRFMAAWCHGAPGIGLARLACLPWMDDGETRAELERALAITLRRAPGQADHLCCGSAGVIDILAQAGRSLDRPALIHRARALAWHIVQRARQSDDYALGLPSAGSLRMPGLFQGLSGIGLMLLRLTAIEDMPEPLLLR